MWSLSVRFIIGTILLLWVLVVAGSRPVSDPLASVGPNFLLKSGDQHAKRALSEMKMPSSGQVARIHSMIIVWKRNTSGQAPGIQSVPCAHQETQLGLPSNGQESWG
ncbi:hypothetical protein PGT21_026191 [Puccinia graminis f. sp. tritici]|uniref:Uncharacterized protein n=1 Tax=Puccinia graminis f. sp. tritici TaxID=56615 RepID=A0A5B0PBJ6_PUCGR|nr:hypothetical protein PGT21_026191 [Puccinia graminis f. sp. tritici]